MEKEKSMSRPKNADLGKPNRDRRVVVLYTDAEFEELESAADRLGLSISAFIRMAALKEAARKEAGG